MSHFSFSQARTANACPLQWHLSRQHGRGEVSTPAMQGLVMDAYCSSMYAINATNEVAYLDAWQTYLELGGRDEFLFYEAIRDAESVLQALADVTWGIPQHRVEMTVPGVPVPVVGYVDLIDPSHSRVIDYKRGGGYTKEWWDEAKMQVALYSGHLCAERGMIAQVSNGIVRLEEFDVTPELIALAHEFVLNGYLATQFEDRPIATPGRSCSYCDHEPTCKQSVFARWHA